MQDGWEVAYGLDPTDRTGRNGALGDPDDDGITNVEEFNANPGFAAPSFDPRKHYFTSPSRPVVSVSSSAPDAYSVGGTASFTIRRSVGGSGANLNSPLLVYYSVGGTARYGTDYTLSPEPYTVAGDPGHPDGYPRVFLAKIPAGEDSVTISVTPLGSSVRQAGTQTIVIELTPYGVAVNPQVQDPLQWAYVVNLFEERVMLRIHHGLLINVEKTAQGSLRIKPIAETSPLPFINVANSAKGTLARIYTGSDPLSDRSRVVGEYWTKPGGGGDPSRTTVDRYGNVWVGNRAVGDAHGGSITQIGVVLGGTRCNSDGRPDPQGHFLKPPFIYNTCVDRNRDGLIKTSRGLGDVLEWPDNLQDSLGGVSQAEDEAILRYVRVAPTAVRSIVVDRQNHVWVGSRNNHWHEFIDGLTGMPVTGWRVNFQGGGYGGVIDGRGAVWSSGYDPNAHAYAFRLLRFLPAISMPLLTGGTIRATGDNYGIAVDPNTGDVWQPLHNAEQVMHFRADHCTTRFEIDQRLNRGLVIDGRGNIWVGGSSGHMGQSGEIFHLTTSGGPVGAIPMSFTPPGQSTISGWQPIGVTVDALGMVWAVCQTGTDNHGWAMRIDPFGREVVEVVDLGQAAGPYNYSDMSGFVALSATQPAGVWDYVEDGGAADQVWNSLTMDAHIPAGTRIIVEVRAANSLTELPAWPFRPVVNAQGVTPPGTTALPAGIKGRYLEVRVNLLRDFGVASSPELRNLTVQKGALGCSINIREHPMSQAVEPGANVSFQVSVQVPAGATPTYQWLKDGQPISGANAATLTLHNVNFAHAGRYSVRVGAPTGCGTFQLESAPARLHVKGLPPVLVQDLPASLTVPERQQVTLRATASGGSRLGETPIRYQWRRNNEPLSGPGTSGQCNGSLCTAELTVRGECTNAGVYSVAFWNAYGQITTVNCEVQVEDRLPVAVAPNEVVVTDSNQHIVLTATTCLADVSCVQWYLTRDGRKTPIPPNPPPEDPTNPLKYKIPTPITCAQLGLYTVSVADRAWNAYEASADVYAGNTFNVVHLSRTILEVTPEDVGSGHWTYQWSFSQDGVNYSPIGNATSQRLELLAAPNYNGYYKLTARRAGATAIVKLSYNVSNGSPAVQLDISQNAVLRLTYVAEPTWPDLTWVYQWYFTPEGAEREVAISGATASQYTIHTVDCTRKGTYRVQVNCGGSSASASVGVNAFGLSSTTLEIQPHQTADWSYIWFVSADGLTYQPLQPNPGTPAHTLPTRETPLPGRYYKVVATGTGATAEARFFYRSDVGGTSVQVVATDSADANVTFTAGTVGTGGSYRWYFTPLNGQEADTGVTGSSFTIRGVGCGQRGSYRARMTDGCGRAADASATVLKAGCP